MLRHTLLLLGSAQSSSILDFNPGSLGWRGLLFYRSVGFGDFDWRDSIQNRLGFESRLRLRGCRSRARRVRKGLYLPSD